MSRALAFLAGLAVVGLSIFSFFHAFDVNRKVGDRFERHPDCSAEIRTHCFSFRPVRIVGGYTHTPPKLSTHYYVDIAGERASDQVELEVNSSGGYDVLLAAGEAQARVYDGQIVGLISGGVDYATGNYPGGGTVWIIIGTLAAIFGGAAVLGSLLLV